MELYNDIKKSRPSDRRNDCSVVSVSIATGTAYDVTEKMFASMGRRFNRGSSIPMITAAVSHDWTAGRRHRVLYVTTVSA